jgi:signal transduction histidine kinase
MLRSFVAYCAVLGLTLALVSAGVHVLVQREMSLETQQRLQIVAQKTEEALEHEAPGMTIAEVLASTIESPDEGLAYYDASGRLVGAFGTTVSADQFATTIPLDEGNLRGRLIATISNAVVAPRLFRLDLALAILTIVAMLVGGTIITVISKRALDRVNAMVQRLNRFTGDASHELRTPLTIIANNADALALVSGDADASAAGITNIRSAVAQMRTLMDGLLILARSDANAATNNLHAVDIARCVQTIAAARREQAAARALTLRVRTLANQTIYGEPSQVARIVDNLVENALRYTPPGGTVEIVHRADKDGAVIEISDTGIGLQSAQLERIFDRFWRGSDRPAGEGAGLGLAIARSLARAHGGDIWARSRPGEGSTFIIKLPSRPPRTSAASTYS